jgi:hypothetical protein
MTTKRTPINRPQRRRLTPKAIETFRKMLECDGEEWWQQHRILCLELRCKPWEFPAVQSPDVVNPYPAGSYAAERWQPDADAQARWRELERAAREAGDA